MVVLPAALVWAEQRGPLRMPRSRAELAALGRGVGTGGARRRRRRRPVPLRGTPAALRRTARRRARAPYHHASDGRPTAIRSSTTTRAEREAEKARGAARPYSIAVGVLFLGLIVFAGINVLSNDSPGPAGLAGGTRCRRSRRRRPPGGSTATPRSIPKKACTVQVPRRDPDLRLLRSPARAGGVVQQVRRPLRAACSTPSSASAGASRAWRFVGLDIADSLDEARKAVQENGWGFPMAVDRDGAVGVLYRVGVGPTTSSHILAACWRARRSGS